MVNTARYLHACRSTIITYGYVYYRGRFYRRRISFALHKSSRWAPILYIGGPMTPEIPEKRVHQWSVRP